MNTLSPAISTATLAHAAVAAATLLASSAVRAQWSASTNKPLRKP